MDYFHVISNILLCDHNKHVIIIVIIIITILFLFLFYLLIYLFLLITAMCLSFIVISIPYFSYKPVIRCLIIARCIIVILDVYSIIWKFQKLLLLLF